MTSIDRRRRFVPATVIAAAVVLVLAMGAGVWWYAGDRGPTSFKATFIGTVGIYPGSDVRMLGIKVGEVDSIEPEGTSVTVTMHLDHGFAAQPGTDAVILSPSLVSDRYVQLTKVWTSGPKLTAGTTIPIERTATPVELDQIYSSVLQLTGALGPNGVNSNGSLSDLLNTGAANLGGNGQALNQTIAGLGAASSTLANSKDELFATVTNLSQFTDMLEQNDANVSGLNTRLADVSQVLANDRRTFAQALSELSSALATVQGFIRDNRGALTADVDKLATITQTLVDERDSLQQALSAAPLLVSNLLNSYDPSRGVLDGRGNLNELTLWTAVGGASVPAGIAGGASSPATTTTTTPTALPGDVGTPPAGSPAGPPLLLPSAGGTS